MRAWLCVFALWCVGCSGVTTVKGTGKLEPFAPEGVTNQAARGKKYALLVGIQKFEDPKFRALRYASADALALGKALREFDEVVVLQGEQATSRASILAAMKRLSVRVRGRRDTVVVYFSTHGTLARAPGKPLRRYLVTRDTRLDLVAQTGLRVRDVVRWMDRLPSRRKALILAACHSGAGKSQVTDALARALARSKASPPALESTSEASIILSASAFREVATEDERLGHDVYTHFLLEGIGRGDRDQDGATTISEAHDWARERTYQFTRGIQRPTSQSSILGRDPIILRGSVLRRPKPLIFSYSPSSKGVEVYIGGKRRGVLPGGIALEPGRHRLELRGSDAQVLYQGEMSLEPGGRFDIADLIAKPPTWGLDAEVAVAAPWGTRPRQELWPMTPALGARVDLRGWPWEPMVLELGGQWGRGAGSARAFGEEIPFELEMAQVYLGGGVRWELGWSLTGVVGGRVGAVWARRVLGAGWYQDEESLWGPRAGGLVRLEWAPLKFLRVGVGAETFGVQARLGDAGWHAFGALHLLVGVSL